MDGRTDGRTDGWTDRPTDRWMDRHMDEQLDGQTNGQKISFYRTLFPIGAAALLPPMLTRVIEQGKGTADHLMPLC